MKKRALISGITGQDGSYLAEFLLRRGYKVFGGLRRTSSASLGNVAHLEDLITILPFDLTDQGSISKAIIEANPDEVYNLGAQSFVKGSWEYPIETMNITGLGAVRVLEALRLHNPKARFYQASSSEMFGNGAGKGQTHLNEDSALRPRSPYGVAKVMAHLATVNYRESYDMFACCGILFNHESPRRGLEFVTRKVTDAVAKIKLGKQETIELGNVFAERDWGFAGDYVEAMWLMLQQDQPEDFVIATGKTYSVLHLCKVAFESVGIKDWEQRITTNAKFKRPAEIDVLIGDARKAKRGLGWEPTMDFEKMIQLMVREDIKRNDRAN